jgi:hypothetical protein
MHSPAKSAPLSAPIYSRFFDTTASDRSINAVDGLLVVREGIRFAK